MNKKEKSLLVVAAHPDDEIRACGATVRLRVDQDWTAHLVVMTAGVTGRLTVFDVQDKTIKSEQQNFKNQMQKSAGIVGFKSIHCHDFPDNRLDTVSRMDLTQALIPHMKGLRPESVITPPKEC